MGFISVIRLSLLPLALLFGVVTSLRRSFYRYGILGHRSVKTPTLSIGALHVGGLGKTPIAHQVLEELRNRGIKPAFLSRGYGRKSQGPCLRRGGQEVDPARIGDEPAMIAELIPELDIVVSADRFIGARLLEESAEPGCIVLDDAFSHLSFRSSLEFIVVPGDALEWFEAFPMPTGTMRESWNAQGLAKEVVYWFHVRGGPVDVEAFHPKVRALWESIEPAKRIATGTVVDVAHQWGLADSENRRIYLSAGIARPDGFRRSVQSQEWEIVGTQWHRDHVPWTQAMFDEVLKEAARLDACVGITLKDATKLKESLAQVRGQRVVVFKPTIVWASGEEHFKSLIEAYSRVAISKTP